MKNKILKKFFMASIMPLFIAFTSISYANGEKSSPSFHSIDCKSNHCLALTSNGVLAVGYNYNNELGLGDTTNRTTWTKTLLNNIKEISIGTYYSLSLDNSGAVWAVGHNGFGQLGLGDDKGRNLWTKTPLTNIKQITAGDSHSLALDNNGDIWAVGNNVYGQLGISDITHMSLPPVNRRA